jgi:translation initiation factor 2B subunit (eIF-2B alpha/beta/delta family)/8-oxo-dGTP pyrophosphatase MutT (NUDIX family)
MMVLATSSKIRRVVSCFLLLDDKVAVFHRQDTMPTFPSHWAAISGSIEEGETPWEAAQRELCEETNLQEIIASLEAVEQQHGLYVDVPFHGRPKQARESDPGMRQPEEHHGKIPPGSIIRVYPFVVQVGEHVQKNLERRGSEHDNMQWITTRQLQELAPAVPALATAFHHATRGDWMEFPVNVRDWASDRVSGAATLARQAVELVKTRKADPSVLKMLRPSMVAITNVLRTLEQGVMTPQEALESLEREGQRAVDLAVERVGSRIRLHEKQRPFTIALFSRSSTILSITRRVLKEHQVHVVSSQSSPGDEGLLMAHDLAGVPCFPDEIIIQKVTNGEIDLILVGCDCIMEHQVVNKVGTAALARAAKASSNCQIFCCSDRWKIWDDTFPPPLEPIFETILRSLFDEIVIPLPK